MKTRFLIITGMILAGFAVVSSGNTVFGLWMPETPEILLEQSQTVFVGTITSVNVLEFQRSNSYNVEEKGVSRIIVENYTQPLEQYTVNIEEFLKNPQELHTITMLEATVSGPPGHGVSIGGFELGDRVLFYVPKIDGTNQYSPESFKIPKYCDAKDVMIQKRLQMSEDFTITQDGIKVDYGNFTANKPIKFVYGRDVDALDGKSFDVAVVISKNEGSNLKPILNQEIHAESKPCEWIASATWGFTPEKGDYTMSLLKMQDNATYYEYSGFSVKSYISNNLQSPLKQFKSGISIEKIQCREGLQLVLKNWKGNWVCVKNTSVEKLILRNYIYHSFGSSGEEVPSTKISNQTNSIPLTLFPVTPQNVTLPDTAKKIQTDTTVISINKINQITITNSDSNGQNTHPAQIFIKSATLHTKDIENLPAKSGFDTLVFDYTVQNKDKDAFYAMLDFEIQFGSKNYPVLQSGNKFSEMLLPNEKRDSTFVVQIGKGINQIALNIKDTTTKKTLWVIPIDLATYKTKCQTCYGNLILD